MPTQGTDNTFRQGVGGKTMFDVLEFFFRQEQSRVRTTTIVQVTAVSVPADELDPVGYVDFQPMVHQVDGKGNITKLPEVFNAPYMRLQGGTNAIVIDPIVGDIGIAVFADRDISTVKTSKAVGAPGSDRRNSLADAMYLGGILNGVPTQYVQFKSTGILVKSPNLVTIDSPKTKTTQDLEVGGKLQVDGDTELKAALKVDGATAVQDITAHGVSIDEQHTHTSESPGTPTSPVIP